MLTLVMVDSCIGTGKATAEVYQVERIVLPDGTPVVRGVGGLRGDIVEVPERSCVRQDDVFIHVFKCL